MSETDKAARSAIMARVPSRDTAPELRIRRALFALGLRYRLHDSALPGKPDIVLRKHCTVIFVHGCFWHWHGCRRSRMPKTNVDYWHTKISRNQARDQSNMAALVALGWRVLIVWECALTPRLVSTTAGLAMNWLRHDCDSNRAFIEPTTTSGADTPWPQLSNIPLSVSR